MDRLSRLVRSDRLKGTRVIVTGCGYKPLQHAFYDLVTGEPTHDPIKVDGREMKLNIGSAVAGVLALNGADVHMVSTSSDKLENIRKSLVEMVGNERQIQHSALDLLSEIAVKEFVRNLPRDKPVYWVQSVGLGAGSYKLKDDNPYLSIEDIPLELLESESRTVLRATHLMMQALLPIFKAQRESRVAVVTSMSAVRGYELGGTHCAAKGAIDRYANSAMLALYKHNIFVTSVRPGIVDTGMYDASLVIEVVKSVGKTYGLEYEGNKIPLAPPTSVGEAIAYVLTTPAHIPSLNLVARKQFPNEGS